MIGEHYQEKWDPYRQVSPWPLQFDPLKPIFPANPGSTGFPLPPPVTREEFDALRSEVLEMKALLIRAKRYDEENGEKDCEIDDKVALLKKVAELVGVSLDDVFGTEKVKIKAPK